MGDRVDTFVHTLASNEAFSIITDATSGKIISVNIGDNLYQSLGAAVTYPLTPNRYGVSQQPVISDTR